VPPSAATEWTGTIARWDKVRVRLEGRFEAKPEWRESFTMSEGEGIEGEPPDNPCERCGHPKPRLVFNEMSRLLLCEQCLESIKSQQAWSLLSKTETV